VTVNGNVRDLPEAHTVADLLDVLGAPGRGSAVAVDGVVVPRGEWPRRQLRDGEQVELVTAVQGG
jgi:sulfur carrier protein